ncbi:uncharacterized protein LOC111642734 [Copidosoma floridanum]|uniref:uncharacterized protein LOC111642734 n=1 Tax=Copidosoma floridanum TaxID=29053 RepID=UPI000C6FA118|nr:uncharacterized protein LOC111642734 [Copidosoma floridanum]
MKRKKAKMCTDEHEVILPSIMEELSEHIKKGLEISPYLSAIQQLNGNTPGEKYKELNEMVQRIVQREPSGRDTMENVPPALAPLVKILVGNATRSESAVIEALKSEDITIFNQALQCKWFFKGPSADVNLIVRAILPQVSRHARFHILKAMTQSLIGKEKRAEEFFTAIQEGYSYEEAVPFVPLCGEDFIKSEMLKGKLIISSNLLLQFYQRHPNMVMGLLKSFIDFKKSGDDPSHFFHPIKFFSNDFFRFLKILIRHRVKDFVQLLQDHSKHEGLPKSGLMKLGGTVTKLFFKSASQAVVDDPELYLRLWPMKVIGKKIRKSQFEAMFMNLLPADRKDFNYPKLLNYLKYYPTEERLGLISGQFKSKYGIELFSDTTSIERGDLEIVYEVLPVEEFEKLLPKYLPGCADNIWILEALKLFDHIKYPKEKRLSLLLQAFRAKYKKDLYDSIDEPYIKTPEFGSLLKLMPAQDKIRYAKKLITLTKEFSEEYYDWYSYLPPSETFSVFTDLVYKSSRSSDRCTWIKHMLHSVGFYEDKENLLKLLRYYNEHHKNEKIDILGSVLCYLSEQFNLKTLDRANWNELWKMMQRAHTNHELGKLNILQIKPFLRSTVYHLMIQSTTDHGIMSEEGEKILNLILEMTIDYNLNSTNKLWILIKKNKFQGLCFDKMLKLMSTKYPRDHCIWEQMARFREKNKAIVSLLRDVVLFNDKGREAVKKSIIKEKDLVEIRATDYPWFANMIKEAVHTVDEEMDGAGLRDLRELLSKNDEGLLRDCFPKPSTDELEPVTGWLWLKKNPEMIFNNLTSYLDTCRLKLHSNSKRGATAARRFLLSTRWHRDLPRKIIEICLQDIQGDNVMKILAIMLERDVFDQLVAPFRPKRLSIGPSICASHAKTYHTLVKTILPAMNLTNPPVSFHSISYFFQGDYVQMAIQTYSHVVRRAAKSKMIAFAMELTDESVSMRKHRIKIFCNVAVPNEIKELIRKLWMQESNVSMRESIVSVLKERLVKSPSDINWRLMEFCMDHLNANDQVPMALICDMDILKNRAKKFQYASQYISKILAKIESFSEEDLQPIVKSKLISSLLSTIRYNIVEYMNEDLIINILDKYYFEENSEDVLRAVIILVFYVFSEYFISSTKESQ